MASSNFDELTKALATSISRRQTIKVLFASVLAGVLGFGGAGTLQAQGCTEPCAAGESACGSPNDNYPIWKHVQCCAKGSQCTQYHDCKDVTNDWVVLDSTKPHYLLLPTARRAGIECSELWKSTAPNYWDAAWKEASKFLSNPKPAIGLAVNSKHARCLCQLHIHMSCIRKDVKDTLDAPKNASKIAQDAPADWKKKTLSLPPDGNSYHVLHLKSSSFPANLFLLLRQYVAVNDSDMQYQTLVVTQSSHGGYYIINSAESGLSGGDGHGEKLLDEACSNK